ncbi:MAG TPA: TonB-dependent receptor [Blastocatellia bacterium]|nr:TonB-dependent receptor [Blastocatellia bacterium]
MTLLRRNLLILFFYTTLASCLFAQTAVTGRIVDEQEAPIAGAVITVQSATGAALTTISAAADGTFTLADLPAGTFTATIRAPGFQSRQLPLRVPAHETAAIQLRTMVVRESITVTAQRGAVETIEQSAHLVTSMSEPELRSRPLATIGNALEGAPGVLVQQSTYGQVSPFLRGLTGYQVLNLVDGVRFNNATFRSGPNQYLAFIEPGQVERLEALLGPSSAQYGSDALGGTINVVTAAPTFVPALPNAFSGEWQAFGASADAGGGSQAKLTFGTKRLAFLFGGAWQKHNDLRAGRGADSRHVLHRFLGLSQTQIRSLLGARQQDTGFTQYGWHTKAALRLRETQSLSWWYQRGVLEGVRGYKDLWGGLGRLRSDFAPQDLHFGYLRHEWLKLGWADAWTNTVSVNAQRDGSRRQNLRTTDRITTDDNMVTAFGYQSQATKQFGARQALVLGGELYRELLRTSRVEFDPTTNVPVQRRALFPSGSRYTTLGMFVQHNADWWQQRLRTNVGGRFTRIGVQTFASRNRTPSGTSLGVADADERFQDVTFNASATWRVTTSFHLHALTGRGFRAPNLNDLGALGLNDLGFEIPASAAVTANALQGSSDGENALSSGRKIAALQAESLHNYELGMSWQAQKFYARAQVFDAELKQPIVRRTLLFATDAVPASLAGLAVTPIPPTPEQRAQNVVTVATALDARAVKAFVNDGAAKYYGVDALACYNFSPRLLLEGNYSYLVGRELNPNRFIRRLPPQHGHLSLRYQPTFWQGRVAWLELSSDLVGAQKRLSGGDLTDERIGAAIRRSDIASFFRGSLLRPFLQAGNDGTFGTADDQLAATGETLLQIQNRLLPLGATINGVRISDDNSRAPVFVKTAGYATLHLRGSFRLSESVSLDWAAMNLLDKNYRTHGSGMDAPGRNWFVRLRMEWF